MNISVPLQIGLSGISRGLENIQEIATDISRIGTEHAEDSDSTADLAELAVDLRRQELATLASITVVEKAEEILGTLIDTTA